MINKSNVSSQKLRGGYYTPSFIAKYLWDWVNESDPKTVLEPSAGDGALIYPSYEENDYNTQFTAIEIKKSEAKRIKNHFCNNVHVIAGDFYKWFENNNNYYDAVIANPPYIRYQYLSSKQRTIQSKIMESCGLKANRLINSWVTFVVASLKVLKSGGKAGFVLPSDLLQVSYAAPLRYYLSTILNKMYLVTFKRNVFRGTQQNVVLLLCEKKSNFGESINFKHIISTRCKMIPKWTRFPIIKLPNIDNKKWTSLNLNNNDIPFIYKIKKHSIPFSELANIHVGITTGANKYFSLTYKEVNNLAAKRYVIPLLCRSTSVRGLNFNKSTLKYNKFGNRKIWLLFLNKYMYNQLPHKLQNYLKKGKENNLDKRYKLRIRHCWYHIPSVWSPDLFFLRRIGREPQLIANSINAVSTDTFHRVNLLYSHINKRNFIFAFYSSITQVSIELAGRHFGGGALEVLPGDVSDIYMPNINYRYSCSSNDLKNLNTLILNKKYLEASSYVDHKLMKIFNIRFNSERLLHILKLLRYKRINR